MAHRIFIVLLFSQMVVLGVQTNKLVTGQSVAKGDQLTNVAQGGGGGGTNVTGGLVFWAKLDESSGTTAADSAGPNTGTASYGSAWTTGIIGNCYQFFGTNSINFGNGDTFTNDTVRSTFSIAFWVNVEPGNAGGWAISRARDGSTAVYGGGGIDGASGKAVVAWSYNSSVWAASLLGTSVLTNSAWHHIAWTFDSGGNSSILYVDGAVEASGGVSSTLWNGSDCVFYVGGFANTPGFSGKIDEIHFWDRAITAGEVLQQYNYR